jgi:hypothetical protein
LAFERAARFGLGSGLWRRLARALLHRNGLDSRDVAAHLPHPRRVLELAGRPLKAQVELLLLELEDLVVELVDGHGPQVTRLHHQLLEPIPRCAR